MELYIHSLSDELLDESMALMPESLTVCEGLFVEGKVSGVSRLEGAESRWTRMVCWDYEMLSLAQSSSRGLSLWRRRLGEEQEIVSG
jgi:hypothetical protein